MIAYMIKVILCSALLLVAYRLFLEQVKMHKFNRFYLLFALGLSFVIPVLSFSFQKEGFPLAEAINVSNALPPVGQAIYKTAPASVSDHRYLILFTFYCIITAILLFRFAMNINFILKPTRKNRIIPFENANIVLLKEDLTPYSFLNFIFINEAAYISGKIHSQVLTHELSHVRQRHSFDIIFIEIITIIIWFNPLVYLYKKAIQLNHEFLADEAVATECQDTAGYQYLLIESAAKKISSALTSRFNYSTTKKRLIMMTKTKSFFSAICRQFAILPVVALAVFLFSSKTIAQDTILKVKQKETPSTYEGASKELMEEYEEIVARAADENGFPSSKKISDADRSRLETIFLLMSKTQQAQQKIIFFNNPPPFSRAVPTAQQIETWKNSKVYGLWINEKRVDNTILNNHKNTDFAHFFVSKLQKNAINYGKHYYQVNLMTPVEYDDYYEKALKNRKKYAMVFHSFKKRKS